MTREEHDRAQQRDATGLFNVPTIEELAEVSGRDEDELRKAAHAITKTTQPGGDRGRENAPQPQSRSDGDGTAVEPRPQPGCGEELSEGMILWRRHDAENVPKLVAVKQCLKDVSDGHFEYVLIDLTDTYEWRYHEEDLRDCFWDTGLSHSEPKPVMDDQVREVYQRVCSHSFHTVHNRDGTPVGEQCIKCREFRGMADYGSGT